VTLVAFALFAIEISVLVPFTYLYWNRLLALRRDALELQAEAARPHVREALLRDREGDSFEPSTAPVIEEGLRYFVYKPTGAYQMTAAHQLTPALNAPPRSVAAWAFEPGSRPTFSEVDSNLVYVTPIYIEDWHPEGRADAVLYVSGSLVEMKKQFAAYGILSFLVGAATLLVMGTITIYHLRRRFLLPLGRIIVADNAARRGDEARALIGDEDTPEDELGTIIRSRNALIGRMTKAQRSLDEKNLELEKQRAELAAWGRELERLVQEKTKELVAARESLYVTEKLAALGRLAANVAHEINNPLASIAGYAEEVRDRLSEIDAIPADLPEGLRVIEEQAFRCKEILKRLLGLARSDRFKVEPIDLVALARDTVRFCEPQARKKKIVLRLQQAPDTPGTNGSREPVVVVSDASSLQQVILNLVENALDAAGAAREQRGSGGLVVVSVTARSAGGAAGDREFVIRVADDGFGVPEAIRDRVFDPFYTTKPVGRGTGLGLAICQSIVERLGGRIEIESVEGEGATFVVVLPQELPPGTIADGPTPARGIWAGGEPVGPEDEALLAAHDAARSVIAGEARQDHSSLMEALSGAAEDADPDARAAASVED
jgi:signal transduction histidine kinase